MRARSRAGRLARSVRTVPVLSGRRGVASSWRCGGLGGALFLWLEFAGEALGFVDLVGGHADDEAVQGRAVALALCEGEGNPFVGLDEVDLHSGTGGVARDGCASGRGRSSW